MVRASSRPVGLLVLLCCLVSVIWHLMSGFSFQSGVGCGFVISCGVQCPSSTSGIEVQLATRHQRSASAVSIVRPRCRSGFHSGVRVPPWCSVCSIGRLGPESIFQSGIGVHLLVRGRSPASGPAPASIVRRRASEFRYVVRVRPWCRISGVSGLGSQLCYPVSSSTLSVS